MHRERGGNGRWSGSRYGCKVLGRVSLSLSLSLCGPRVLSTYTKRTDHQSYEHEISHHGPRVWDLRLHL